MLKVTILAIMTVGQTVLVRGVSSEFNPDQEVTLVPRPKSVQWSALDPYDLAARSVVIVTGNRAEEPEIYAAGYFRERVLKWFGLSLPIVGEGNIPVTADLLILPGQRSTNDLLNQLCADNGIDLSPSSPGHDGYVIADVQNGARRVVLVGGSNPRGVVYGMDTLFQCVVPWSGTTVMARGTVRDWPTIPWRGRPQTSLDHFFRPGEWDTYATARINFTDLRDGIYAFEPGTPLDGPKITTIIQEAHRRGILVFGTVNCGVATSKYNLVIGTFTEFINLGVDGLWMSFDDMGWGDDPVSLVTQVVNLANTNGISGPQLAVSPSKGGYQNIDDPDNRPVMNIPGMKNALWFFTRIPSETDHQTGLSMGLQTKPSWWHNWPRPRSGFTHVSNSSLRQDGIRSYFPVPALSEGWHSPGYEILAAGGQYCQASMPWGGNGWPQYYIVPVIAWWSWNPEGHDFTQARRRIYDIVFGTTQVDTAMQFDDTLDEARRLFEYGANNSEAEVLCQARLKDEADRTRAQVLFDQMEALLDGMEAGARQDTMLVSVDVLDEQYLSAMRGELATGRIAAELSYPEYWWNDHQRELLNALYDGDATTVNTLASLVRSRIYADVDQIGTQLSYLQYVAGYRTWWRNRAALDASGWQNLVNQRKSDLAYWINEYGKFSDPDLGRETVSNMLSGIDSPPFMEYGIGRWNTMNRLLAKVVPDERGMFWGELMAGVYRSGEQTAAVFAIPRKIYANAGGFAELPIRLPMLGNRERLSLMIYMSSVNKIDFAWDVKPYRWTNRRFVRLLWEDQVLWEADAGVQRNRGGWFWANLPRFPEGVDEIPLRLRIEDDDFLENNNNIVFVGPLWLLERSEK